MVAPDKSTTLGSQLSDVRRLSPVTGGVTTCVTNRQTACSPTRRRSSFGTRACQRRSGATGSTGQVVEGELVDEPPSAVSVVLRPVQVIGIIVQHEHTRAAGRHLAYIPIGVSVMIRRLWDSRMTARYERSLSVRLP